MVKGYTGCHSQGAKAVQPQCRHAAIVQLQLKVLRYYTATVTQYMCWFATVVLHIGHWVVATGIKPAAKASAMATAKAAGVGIGYSRCWANNASNTCHAEG